MMINTPKKFTEGEIINKYFRSRVMEHNQNVLFVVTGRTGSGKSFACLKIAELWYKFQFNEPFPSENVCFSLEELISKLRNPEGLRKGTCFCLEEVGVIANSLDFQTKVSKMFSFVLQSFRSMNLILIMNLPVITFLNKTARLLLHAHLITAGINYETKISTIKAYFLQPSQFSNKIYHHNSNVVVNKRVRKVGKFHYGLPDEKLIEEYEVKKKIFVSKLIEDFHEKFNEPKQPVVVENSEKTLTPYQQEVFDDWKEGLTMKQSAEKRGKTQTAINQMRETLRIKGYSIEKKKKSIGKVVNTGVKSV